MVKAVKKATDVTCDQAFFFPEERERKRKGGKNYA